MERASFRYRSKRPEQTELQERLKTLAAERPRWGYRRLHVLLRRKGHPINVKRTHRLYRELGLMVRKRNRKRVAVVRNPLAILTRANRRWSMDFVSDALESGRRIRCLTVVDDFTRECLAIEVDTSLPGLRVVRVLERIAAERGGLPEAIVLDNGPEASRAGTGSLGLCEGDHAGIHLSRQTGGERIRGEFQRAIPGRVPQRALVHQPGRSPADH